MNHAFVRDDAGCNRPFPDRVRNPHLFARHRTRFWPGFIALAPAWLLAASADAANIAQQAYLKASNAWSNDAFGASVAISGNTAVIGARRASSDELNVNHSGVAYVFVRTGANWTQQAALKPSNPVPSADEFGHSVAISGETVVVGVPYEDRGGSGVNSSGTGPGIPDSGAAYIFVRSGTNWTQQAYLKASNAGYQDYFGWSVAVSGDVVIVGAYGEDSDGDPLNNNVGESGAAYVFVRTGTNWSQQAYLKAPILRPGYVFGWAVAASGDTLLISSCNDGSNAAGVNESWYNNYAPGSGAVYVFVRDGAGWKRQAYLKASNPEMNDAFGFAVAISGDTAVIGAYVEASSATGVNGDQTDNSAPESGAAYVFVRHGTNWSQQAYLKASNTRTRNYFGQTVGVSGDGVVVGAKQESSTATGVDGDQTNVGLTTQGAAYVFTRTGGSWSQRAYLKASNSAAGDFFGQAVAISGDIVIATAPLEDSSATGVNGDESNDDRRGSGAAYVFTGVCPSCGQLSIEGSGPNGYSLRFNGVPNTAYRLQRARTLDGAWDTVTTLNAPPAGPLMFHDPELASDQAFYRVVQPW